MSAETITVPKPVVPFGPEGVDPDKASADYLRVAANRIRDQRMFGSNVTRTVCNLLADAADALDGVA